MKKFFAFFALISLFLITLSSECRAEVQVNAYISNSADDTVSVIDTDNYTVIFTINVGDNPMGVAITPDGEIVYVANNLDNTISVISTSSYTVTDTIAVGEGPWGVAVAQDKEFMYVTNRVANTVSVIRTSDNTVTNTIDVGNSPLGITVSPDGEHVYVTNNLDDTVSIIDTSDNTVQDVLDVGGGPWGIEINPNGAYLYLNNSADDTMALINIADNSISDPIDVGDTPMGIAVHPNQEDIYVANNLDNTVTALGMLDILTINVGSGPWGIAVTPDGNHVYVLNNADNTVSVINTSDNTIEATIPVGGSPAGFGKFIGGRQPEAPGELTAKALSDAKIEIFWVDNSDEETEFMIESKKGSGGIYSHTATVGENITTYTHTGLDEYRTYYYRVRAYNKAGYSSYSNEANATTDEDEGKCFIATAAYGSTMDSRLNILCGFRDNHLLPNPAGKAFVDLYYSLSPPAADFISRHDSLRTLARLGLAPLVVLSWGIMKFGPLPALMLILSMTFILTFTVMLAVKRSKSEIIDHEA